MKPKQIAILGATGSIGTQALDVISEHPDQLRAFALTAHNNVTKLVDLAHRFLPEHIVITDPSLYEEVKEKLHQLPVQVHSGLKAVDGIVALPEVDMVLAAMVGFAGLRSTLSAIEAGKDIALANKETLVVAGDLIMKSAQDKNVKIIPVDSEHSAIYQCLVGEEGNPIEQILLTGSGGPFLHISAADMQSITPEQALKHPKWNMGAKITIDSATLMNKGLEMIEACHLFAVEPKQVQVIIHPQSYIHSMVQFKDGVVKAQIGEPDMRLPISYALAYCQRIPNRYTRTNFFATDFSFLAPDFNRFPCLRLAYEAIQLGGNMPCILNAANEIANSAFRNSQISFPTIPRLIENIMQEALFIATPNTEDLFLSHEKATTSAKRLINVYGSR